MDCKWLEVELVGSKKYHAKEETKSTYSVEEVGGSKFGISYCIRYRPVGTLEWILARGWWNDKGVWTADGIFNDGII